MTAEIAASLGFSLPFAALLSLGIILILNGVKRVKPDFRYPQWFVFFSIVIIATMVVILFGERVVGGLFSFLGVFFLVLGVVFWLVCFIASKIILKRMPHD